MKVKILSNPFYRLSLLAYSFEGLKKAMPTEPDRHLEAAINDTEARIRALCESLGAMAGESPDVSRELAVFLARYRFRGVLRNAFTASLDNTVKRA